MNNDILATAKLAAVKEAIRAYFLPLRARLNTMERFIAEKRHRHEITLLLCAYLDALASCVLGREIPSETRLGSLLSTYSSFGVRWSYISLPDLYHLIINAIDYPILFFSSFNPQTAALRKCLKSQGFKMEEETMDEHVATCAILKELREILQGIGRVTPDQGAGPNILEMSVVCSALAPRFSETFNTVVERYQISSILYRDSRCPAVHELFLPEWQGEDKRFWTEEEPYFVIWNDDKVLSIDLLKLAFPAAFLRLTLAQCIDRVEQELIAKRIIPFDLWWDAFFATDLQDLVTLDERTLP
jgi:hypothetical protein